MSIISTLIRGRQSSQPVSVLSGIRPAALSRPRRPTGRPVPADAPAETNAHPTGPLLPYAPALDGLRALAVTAVLLYHAGQAWIPGGFLGVEVFFVISGYLITSLLLAEYSRSGRIDLAAFWLRRARRLFPALAALLVAVATLALFFLPSEVASIRGDLASTGLYVNNWYQIFHHRSYFVAVGRPSPLQHLWSLAVEEQFYILWPLLFTMLLGRCRPRLACVATLGGALASVLWMGTQYVPDADPSRLYYGTDTRASALLIGAALSFIRFPAAQTATRPSPALEAVGLASLVALVAAFLFLYEFLPFLYLGGFALVSLATAGLIAAATHPASRLLGRALALAPLPWIGLRSYSLYLWHFPVFVVTRPNQDVALDGVGLLVIRLILTAALAEFSYRLVERPIREGALQRAWAALVQAQGPRRRELAMAWATIVVLMTADLGALTAAVAKAPSPTPPEYLAVAPAQATPVVVPAVAPISRSLEDLAKPKSDRLLAIGDSVMLGAAPELTRALGNSATVDAVQGRQATQVIAVLQERLTDAGADATVVLHVGDNGVFSVRTFEAIMAELGPARRVVLVNVTVPRAWEAPNNRMLQTAVAAHTNATLVDWHSASAGHRDWFWKDGLHLRPEGARQYAALIAAAAGVTDRAEDMAAGNEEASLLANAQFPRVHH